MGRECSFLAVTVLSNPSVPARRLITGTIMFLALCVSVLPAAAETTPRTIKGEKPGALVGPQVYVTDEIVGSIVDLVHGVEEDGGPVGRFFVRPNPVRVSTSFFSEHSDDLAKALAKTVGDLKQAASIEMIVNGSNEAAPRSSKRDIIVLEDTKEGLDSVNQIFAALEPIIRELDLFPEILPFISMDREVGAQCFVFNIPTGSSFVSGDSIETALSLIVLGGRFDAVNRHGQLVHCMNTGLLKALLPYSSRSFGGLTVPYPSVINGERAYLTIEDHLVLRSLYETGDALFMNRDRYGTYMKRLLVQYQNVLGPSVDRDLFCLECN
jgi:hypothetical protein